MNDEVQDEPRSFTPDDWRAAIRTMLADGVSPETIRACCDAPAGILDEVLA